MKTYTVSKTIKDYAKEHGITVEMLLRTSVSIMMKAREKAEGGYLTILDTGVKSKKTGYAKFFDIGTINDCADDIMEKLDLDVNSSREEIKAIIKDYFMMDGVK